MAAFCGESWGSIGAAFACKSVSKAARNGFVEDGRAGALTGAGGDGRGEPVWALRNGLLELRVGDSAAASWRRERRQTKCGDDQTAARGWTMERQGYLPAGAAMLHN